MENQQKIVSVIVPGMCPHCSKEFLINTKMSTPIISWILKKEDIQVAKDKVKKQVEEAELDKEEKKMFLAWLNKEDTLFGPEEIEIVLSQILKKDEVPDKNKD